jgi:hypothetical protein
MIRYGDIVTFGSVNDLRVGTFIGSYCGQALIKTKQGVVEVEPRDIIKVGTSIVGRKKA